MSREARLPKVHTMDSLLTKQIYAGRVAPILVGRCAVVSSEVISLHVLHLEGVPLLHGLKILVIRGLLVDIKLVVVIDEHSALVDLPFPGHGRLWVTYHDTGVIWH